jgi:SAM-dependent methyltransferase
MHDTARQAELAAIYRARFGHRLEYRRAVWKVLVDDLFTSRLGAPNTVLELGTGYGDFVNQCGAPVRYALDLNPDAKDYLDDDVTFLCQDARLPWNVPDESVDAVFTSNFFEHLPEKEAISEVLREARRVLRPGGRLVALGPNIKHVPGAYWDFWDHTIPLTDLSLAEAMKLSGFGIRERKGRTLPYTMSNVRELPTAFLKVYLRVPLAWRFFGHQFLVVAERPR